MTREEAMILIERAANELREMMKTITMPTSAAEQLQQEIDAHEIAISALRTQQELESKLRVLESNKPLTLDELRMMSGDPAFVVTDRLKEWCIVHSHHSDDVIGGGIIMTRRTAEKRTYPYACYGENWLAYRQKPEEGTV